jgi:hypothetical protein
MADCSELKEVVFREMKELVAATSHDYLLLVERKSYVISKVDPQPHHKLRPHGHCSNQVFAEMTQLF